MCMFPIFVPLHKDNLLEVETRAHQIGEFQPLVCIVSSPSRTLAVMRPPMGYAAVSPVLPPPQSLRVSLFTSLVTGKLVLIGILFRLKFTIHEVDQL